ncbi:hypothetical protein B0T26DRAFT_756764 [Lasiosphaeria miniovina]|uniref:Uncharacterized protein n=1 Tax=Lasiosphaeria miniovina TaxID=1954250 RepID=A0AA39ZT65_9PEZI|nr:uncharacterized protein B0T26DRAFT_756764 [Lasiosphaeria miniovina]KAK0703199.1 hypothetical protein B0T26DRAFT_756764 [Lasiosphaeria miniovina]
MEYATNPARRDVLRRDLGQLLKGTAQQCYIGVLSDIERAQLKKNFNFWKSVMIKRFGLSKTEAGEQLLKCTYTATDCKAGIKFRSYAANKIRLCKAMGINNTHSVLSFIYNGVDLTIQELIFEPDSSTTIDAYLTSVGDLAQATTPRHGVPGLSP